MNAYAKLAIAAAAVLVVAVAGINLAPGLNSSSAARPTSSPAASPTASPSVAPSHTVASQQPVEFTGRIACGPAVRIPTEETLDVGDDGTVVVRYRQGAWNQTVSMSDSRLEGVIYQTWEADTYKADVTAADGPQVTGYTWRITNDEGSWESRGRSATFADGTPIGEPAEVLIGAGGYKGLVAVFEVTAESNQGCVIEVRGVIFEGAPVPEPFVEKPA